MFALGVELLMGRAVITRWDNREEPEWPPHPDRVLLALVAAWGESGEDEAQLSALEWLEKLGPPELLTPEVCSVREPFTTYVPVNDDGDPTKTKSPPIGTYPLPRHRVGRAYPVVIPESDSLCYRWQGVELPAEYERALSELCGLVTYLGHSATPVQVWVNPTPEGEATLTPVQDNEQRYPTHQLRVFTSGRTSNLIARFNRVAIEEHEKFKAHMDALQDQIRSTNGKTKTETKKALAAVQEEYGKKFPNGPPQTLRPQPARWQGYAPPASERSKDTKPLPFDPAIVILTQQVNSRRFGLEGCGLVADGIRRELMRRFGAEPPEWISGHDPQGHVSKQRRPAYLPLAYVDAEHADGHLLGIGIALPRDFEHTEELMQLLLKESDEEEGIPFFKFPIFNPHFGPESIGEMTLQLEERPDRFGSRPLNLVTGTWIGLPRRNPETGQLEVQPARTWATVSPLMLPQFPRRGTLVEDVIARACVDAEYPEPVSVRVQAAPLVRGTPHARSFHVKPRQGRPPRPLIHAEITFPQPLLGPVLIGAGRYAGYGFCRPVKEDFE